MVTLDCIFFSLMLVGQSVHLSVHMSITSRSRARDPTYWPMTSDTNIRRPHSMIPIEFGDFLFFPQVPPSGQNFPLTNTLVCGVKTKFLNPISRLTLQTLFNFLFPWPLPCNSIVAPGSKNNELLCFCFCPMLSPAFSWDLDHWFQSKWDCEASYQLPPVSPLAFFNFSITFLYSIWDYLSLPTKI